QEPARAGSRTTAQPAADHRRHAGAGCGDGAAVGEGEGDGVSAPYLEPSIEPMDWQFRPLSECIEKVDVPKKVQAKSCRGHGSVPIVSQEAGLINGYWDDERDAVRVDSPVVIF